MCKERWIWAGGSGSGEMLQGEKHGEGVGAVLGFWGEVKSLDGFEVCLS